MSGSEKDSTAESQSQREGRVSSPEFFVKEEEWAKFADFID
jgi:hypothetical protein